MFPSAIPIGGISVVWFSWSRLALPLLDRPHLLPMQSQPIRIDMTQPTYHRPSVSHNQQGQTLILVAVSLLSLVGIAALAIDMTTLYVARAEIQHAADAAALAGAK